MHALIHVIAAVVALPYLALAAFFLLVGEAARTKGLFALLDVTLYHAGWMVRWGIYLVPVLWLLLAIAGFLNQSRRMGALALCLLAGGSLVIIVSLHGPRMLPGQLLFLAPCLVVAATGAWLFVRAGATGAA